MFPSASDESANAWSPSPLKRLVRHRGVYWTIAATLAVTAGLTVHRQGADARQLADRLGTTTEVVVADAELAPGEPIAPFTTTRSFPVGLVPPSAILEIPDHASAGRRVPAGAVVTTFDLADPAGPGADEAVIAVGSTAATPPLAPNDPVVLVVAADPFVGLDSRLIDARVVSITEERIVVAVDLDDLADVATALRAGGITVAAGS